jgi:hypothetical protein
MVADGKGTEDWLVARSTGVTLLTEAKCCGTSKCKRGIFSESDNGVCSSTLVVPHSIFTHGTVKGLFTRNFMLPTVSRVLAPALLVPLLLLLTFSGCSEGKPSVVSALCLSSGTQPIIIITMSPIHKLA